MAINLEISNNILQDSNNCQIHYIPASTNANGLADIENQFNQFTTQDENGVLSNSLRGYPLKGEHFQIPANYVGICFQESHKPLDEITDRTLKAFGKFHELTYWNYDKIPSQGDPLKQALEILNISEQICEPISMEEINLEMELHAAK